MAPETRRKIRWGWLTRSNRRTTAIPGRDSPVHQAAEASVRLLTWFLGAVLLGAGAWGSVWVWGWLGRAQAFALHHIEVRGAGRISEAELLDTAGIAKGQPLLRLALGKRIEALMAHPWVESAQIRRHLPDRLRVDVVEQIPYALAMLDELWIVNPNGEAFKRFEAKDRVVLPVISGLSSLSAKPESLTQALKQSLNLIDYFSALRPGALSVEALHHDIDLGLSVALSSFDPALREPAPATVVHLGFKPKERVAQMLKTFDELAFRHMQAEEIWLDHNRDPKRVALRLKDVSPAEAEKSQSVGHLRTIQPRQAHPARQPNAVKKR